MNSWYAKKRGTLKEINEWIATLPLKECDFTQVEETVSLEFLHAPDVHELVVRLSGPHYPEPQ